jgi:hypothetical protein
MASKVSFGSLLRDPLVLGVLGAEVGTNLVGSYMTAEKERQEEEKFQAEKSQVIGQATGVAPTTVPTTGIKSVFSKIGLASPTQPATPYELAAGQAGVMSRKALQMQAIDAAIAKRPIVGPGEGWQNFAKQFTEQTGLTLPDLSKPTPKELKDGQGGRLIFYSRDGKSQDMAVPYRPGTTVFAPPGMSLSKPGQPRESEEEKVRTAGEMAEARGRAGEKVYFEGDAAMPYHNQVMYDADMNPITTKGQTREEVLRNGGAAYGPKEIASIQDAKGLDKQLDDIQKIVDTRLVSSSDPNFQAKRITNHLAIIADSHLSTDSDAYALYNAPSVLAIQLTRLMAQQRMNQQEINAVNKRLGNLSSQSREVATANIKWARDFVDGKLRPRIKASADNGAAEMGRDYANGFWGEAPEAPAEAPGSLDQPPDTSEGPEGATGDYTPEEGSPEPYTPGSPINAEP